MKYCFKTLLILLICTSTVYSQKTKNYKIAEYSFTLKSDENNTGIGELLLNDIKYYLTTNGIKSVLSTSEMPTINPNIHTTISGPAIAEFNIIENSVNFEGQNDTIYKFDPIEGTTQNTLYKINGYTCYSLVTKLGDTLFLSKSLPFYINPFFLNAESIKHGIVKAVLHNSGTFELEKYYSTSEIIPKLESNNSSKVISKKNIFFE